MAEQLTPRQAKSLRLRLGGIRMAWDELTREAKQVHQDLDSAIGHTALLSGTVARVVYIKDGERYAKGTASLFKPFVGSRLPPAEYRLVENHELSVVVTEPEELDINHEFELPYRTLMIYDTDAMMDRDVRAFRREVGDGA